MFVEAARDATTISDLCRRLGIVPRGANDETVRAYAATNGVDIAHLEQAIKRRTEGVPLEELLTALDGAVSRAEVLRRLGREPSSGSYTWLRRVLERHGIDVELDGRGWARGSRRPRRVPIDRYLRRGRLTITTSKLRVRLIEEGILPARCARCGRDGWDDHPIPLELDHVNGDRNDNRRENLRLLCPNCHALTPTYRGRNIGTKTPPG